MREYFGSSAKKYKQPSDKYFTLFPALERNLPQAEGDKKLIDLGCGTGDLFDFIQQKGYEYYGVDYSDDMLNQARERHPSGKFFQSDVSKPITATTEKFDVVLSNMLLPSISSIEDFYGVFRTAHDLMSNNGIVLVGAMHPCFDGYMQKRLFSRDDIDTNFKGYFHSGENYKVHRKLEGNDFIFSDYHWQFSDYFKAAKEAGLYLDSIDECPLTGEVPSEIAVKHNGKGVPNYLVVVLKSK